MNDPFFNQTPEQIKSRIGKVDSGYKSIITVDHRRVGKAIEDHKVDEYKDYLASALPDLEGLFQRGD